MFFFKSRRKYNSSIDELLTVGYRIQTRDNDKFPGVLKYLSMIDLCWQERYTEQEAAMFIATLYYSGLNEHEHYADARVLAKHIAVVGQAGVASGHISMEKATAFLAAIEKSNASVAAKPVYTPTPPTIATKQVQATSSSLLNKYGGFRKPK